MAGHLDTLPDTLVDINARQLCLPGFHIDHFISFGEMTHLVGKFQPVTPVDLAFAADF